MSKKLFDESMNEKLTELSYAMAERTIFEKTLQSVQLALRDRDEDKDDTVIVDPWLNFSLKKLLRECYEEAMTTVYGEQKK